MAYWVYITKGQGTSNSNCLLDPRLLESYVNRNKICDWNERYAVG